MVEIKTLKLKGTNYCIFPQRHDNVKKFGIETKWKDDTRTARSSGVLNIALSFHNMVIQIHPDTVIDIGETSMFVFAAHYIFTASY